MDPGRGAACTLRDVSRRHGLCGTFQVSTPRGRRPAETLRQLRWNKVRSAAASRVQAENKESSASKICMWRHEDRRPLPLLRRNQGRENYTDSVNPNDSVQERNEFLRPSRVAITAAQIAHEGSLMALFLEARGSYVHNKWVGAGCTATSRREASAPTTAIYLKPLI